MGALDRRKWLVLAAASMAPQCLTGCSSLPTDSGGQGETLLEMARLLYPHEGVSNAVYSPSILALLADAKADAQLSRTLEDGVAGLSLAAGADWRTVDRAKKIEVLRTIETTPFFAIVKNSVRRDLYENPAVWDLIGYGGPSGRQGGYLNRGFNDIDWLPKD